MRVSGYLMFEHKLEEWLGIASEVALGEPNEYQLKNAIERLQVVLGSRAGNIPPGEIFVFKEKIRRDPCTRYCIHLLTNANDALNQGNLSEAHKFFKQAVIELNKIYDSLPVD
jgi:hypothetical protein